MEYPWRPDPSDVFAIVSERVASLWLAWSAIALSAIAPTAIAAGIGNADDPSVLVIGRISDDPRRHYDQLKSLLDYVVPQLAPVGIRDGRVLMASDTQQMASYLRRGRVDWVTETAGTGINLADRTGAKVLVVTERDGVSAYHSVIFVRRDSGIRSLADLRGRSIGMQNLNSTSAYLAPAADLLGAGLDLELLLSPLDRPGTESVGYLFAQSENNISTWVHKRLVDAGAYSNLVWENLHRLPLAFRNDLMIIHQTVDYPRAVELVRGDLDPEVEQALREILLSAADDPEGREPLLKFFGTSRFLSIDPAMQKSLDGLRDGVLRVRAELE